MFALRRASIHLRNRGLSSGTIQIFCVKSDITKCWNYRILECQGKQWDELLFSERFYATPSNSLKPYIEVRSFSSRVNAKSNQGPDDDLEDPFSEIGMPCVAVQEAASGDEIDDESASESELSEGEDVINDTQNEFEHLGTETDRGDKRSPKSEAISSMVKAILDAPASAVGKALDRWVEKGNEVTETAVSLTMIHLLKRKIFPKALKLSEWLESTKHLKFHEKHYALRVNLIAKVHGISNAERYIQKIPESFRGKKVYGTLLANCVSFTNVRKAENVFNKMKDLFPLTCFGCNQLLLLYKRTDRKKIANVLLLMEKENIKPTAFTYQILIDIKRLSNDHRGIEQLVERMKSEGLDLNTHIKESLARYYATRGEKDKAEEILKAMEGDDLSKDRWVCQFLLPIYASLGREDEVERIWKVCEPNPRLKECTAAIEAWGTLGRIEDAEAAFEKMLKKTKRPTGKHYTALLNVYANHKMLDKGKELAKQMGESGSIVEPFAWDALIRLHIKAGEVEKADAILVKAIQRRTGKPYLNSYLLKPLFNSYMVILEEYAKRGDVHNAEKIFENIRESGYSSLGGPYQALLRAYVNAKAPAYGFNERVKGDNVIPNKGLADLLARADAFRKSPVDELLE